MLNEELLSIKQVARQVNVDEKTVRRWIKAGELPAIELGGRYRIKPSELQAFLEKHRKQPRG
jgi:excisionase family DNA binding protein